MLGDWHGAVRSHSRNEVGKFQDRLKAFGVKDRKVLEGTVR